MRISDWSSDVCSSDLERGSRAAKVALYAMEHATLMLATSQLGITICSLLILNVSEPAIHHLLAEPLDLTGLNETKIGRASCWERVCHYVEYSVVAISLKKQTNNINTKFITNDN